MSCRWAVVQTIGWEIPGLPYQSDFFFNWFLNVCLIRSRGSEKEVLEGLSSAAVSSSLRIAFLINSNWSRNRAQYLHIWRWNRIIIFWWNGKARSIDSETLCETSLQENIQCFIDKHPYTVVRVQLISIQRRNSTRARYSITQQLLAVILSTLQISSVLNPSISR